MVWKWFPAANTVDVELCLCHGGGYRCCCIYLKLENGPFIYFYVFPSLGMAARLCNLWTPLSVTYLCAHSPILQPSTCELPPTHPAAQVTAHTEMLTKSLQRSSLPLLPLLLPNRCEHRWSQATRTESSKNPSEPMGKGCLVPSATSSRSSMQEGMSQETNWSRVFFLSCVV